MQTNRTNDYHLIALAYLSFVGLGLVPGLRGVAWQPSMQTEFNQPLDAVGLLLLASMAGYLSAGFFSGQMAIRLGNGPMFALGSGLAVLGLLGYVVSPSWWLLLASALVAGLGMGTIDAGMNNYIASHHSARVMNWLHASFGIGVTIGPALMTEVLRRDLSWRAGYGIVCLFQIALALAFVYARRRWRAGLPQNGSHTPVRSADIANSLRQPMVWLSVALFFVYAGLEDTPNQWVKPLYNQSRGFSAEAAGLMVSLYWGSFTAGRIFFSIVMRASATLGLLRASMAGTLAGALLLWWNPTNAVGVLGLVLLGFAQAPLFALLMSATPRRVTAEHTPNTVGFQMAGAGLGIAVLPGLAGVLAEDISLEVVAPFIAVACVLLIALHEVIVARSLKPVAQPSGAD